MSITKSRPQRINTRLKGHKKKRSTRRTKDRLVHRSAMGPDPRLPGWQEGLHKGQQAARSDYKGKKKPLNKTPRQQNEDGADIAPASCKDVPVQKTPRRNVGETTKSPIANHSDITHRDLHQIRKNQPQTFWRKMIQFIRSLFLPERTYAQDRQ